MPEKPALVFTITLKGGAQMEQLKLGTKARDRVTGFEGTITGRAEYLTGCTQYSLTPSVDDKGTLREGAWFDENRLDVVGTGVMERQTAGALGGPQREAPGRTS